MAMTIASYAGVAFALFLIFGMQPLLNFVVERQKKRGRKLDVHQPEGLQSEWLRTKR